jgi:hypothetical protein
MTSAKQERVRHSPADNTQSYRSQAKGKGPNVISIRAFNFQAAVNGSKGCYPMTSISNFESNVYSEEIYSVSESDYNEVMQMMADESNDFEGYGEWSQELEQGQVIVTEHGPILINRDCSHKECTTTRCMKGASYQGIAI